MGEKNDSSQNRLVAETADQHVHVPWVLGSMLRSAPCSHVQSVSVEIRQRQMAELLGSQSSVPIADSLVDSVSMSSLSMLSILTQAGWDLAIWCDQVNVFVQKQVLETQNN